MSIPSVKTIRQIEWLDKLADTDPDEAVTVVRQAMEWAETGVVKPTLAAFIEAAEWPISGRFTRETRVRRALEIIDDVLETFGVEYAHGRGGGLLYANTGETYSTTIIYDMKTGNWRVTSWGDIVEANEYRFR